MTFKRAVLTCLIDKYAQMRGRASRAEYWWFTLAVALYSLTVGVACFAANYLSGGFAAVSGLSIIGLLVLCLSLIGYVALMIPSLCVTVRRFHDVNLSGWWLLAGLVLGAVPLVGWIATIAILAVTLINGTDGDSRYGPDPLMRV